MTFQSVEVPFVTVGNRQVLTAMQVVESPWLADFIKRFPSCFEADIRMDCWVYYPDGDAPNAADITQADSADSGVGQSTD
jgi:hypothetical protein